MGDDQYDKPTGFEAAWKKYGPQDNGIDGLWQEISLWRDFEAGVVDLPPDSERDLWVKYFEKRVVAFKERILKAVFEVDKPFLAKLYKALEWSSPPEPEMNGIRAAVTAFLELGLLVSREDWPSKQEVRHRAEEILQEAGHQLPTERHWPRIFKQAGLSDLPSVTFGRAHKARRSRTK